MSKGFTKDPTAVLDYAFDWTSWLDLDETIESHSITLDDGLNLDDHHIAGGVITVWLSGGTSGTRYAVHCHITTSAAREDTRTITILVEPR